MVLPGSSFGRGDSRVGKGDPDGVISPWLNSCLLDSSKSVSSRILIMEPCSNEAPRVPPIVHYLYALTMDFLVLIFPMVLEY